MTKRKMQIGICRLCKKEKKLSFEHIPPRVAFNKNTRYYSISHGDFANQSFLDYKPTGRVQQGGLGYYTLCRDCNSFLNNNYVRPFSKWANVGMDINLKYDFQYIEFEANNQNPLRILKQIVSMFICMNDVYFTELYPELLDFILDVKKTELPDKYKIYHYLNKEGQIRTLGLTFTNMYGAVCELTFPPFGYVLNIDNGNELNHLTEITGWRNYEDSRNHSFTIGLYRYPTHIPIPLDFRSKEEIKNAIKKSRY